LSRFLKADNAVLMYYDYNSHSNKYETSVYINEVNFAMTYKLVH